MLGNKTTKEVSGMAQFIYKQLSYKILQVAFSVQNIMGPGLLESAYEGAMCVELRLSGLQFTQQHVFPLYYKGEYIGAYIADLVVEGKIILELKSASHLTRAMEAQLLNYLRLSNLQVGYLMNFSGESLEWKRFVNQQ